MTRTPTQKQSISTPFGRFCVNLSQLVRISMPSERGDQPSRAATGAAT